MEQLHEPERRILELLNRGDWACAYDERGELAAVLRELASLLDPPLRRHAEELATHVEAPSEPPPTRAWVSLASTLRHHH